MAIEDRETADPGPSPGLAYRTTIGADPHHYSYYGPLNRVTANMGFHVEHHDFFDVPGSRLPELSRLAREYYEPLVSHRSWSGILWTFITSPRLSHYRRFVREQRHVRGSVVRTVPHGPGVTE